MDLPSRPVYDALVEEGVTRIYHANTVLTACHFLRERSLLSRGTAERRGLEQTEQYTDELDKRYSIWFDVFVDSVDIHARAGKENNYGPVLFVIDIALIKKTDTGRVWVTKLNPTKWKGKPRQSRWFESVDEIREGFTYGTFDHMIVFRHCGGELPFGRFLKEIVLDDPEMETEGVDLYSGAFGALQSAMTDSGLKVPIKRRQCNSRCRCRSSYRSRRTLTDKRFMPVI